MSEKPDAKELFRDGRAIDAALAKAVREAVLEHKRAGNPIAVWKDGRVVWIPAEEITVDEEPAPSARARPPVAPHGADDGLS